MKKLYEVVNVHSGHSFGHIAAKSGKDALDLISQDAGYKSYEEACTITDSDDLAAEEIDVRELVDEWFSRLLEEDPGFRCMTMRQLSEVIVNANAPAFPTLPEEFVDEAYDIAWEILMEIWKEQIREEAHVQGLDMEALDPDGSGVDEWIIWRVLEGTSVTDAVADWVEWKKEEEEEEEGQIRS